ncbi:putative reverse transcriptase, RNA-dependent DNA polymerase [Tanacetum coccineum]
MLIEAAKAMLADFKLPTTFWAKAVNTACYGQNRVLVTKPHNKTPYELFLGRKLALGFMRPFGCSVTILNTIDHLGKFDGKADEGFFVGYSINSKAFRVFNSRTRIVEENLHVQFSTKACDDAGKARMETVPGKYYILLPLWIADPPFSQSSKSSPDAGFKPSRDDEKKVTEELGKEGSNPSKEGERDDQEKDDNVNSINNVNAAGTNEVKQIIKLSDDLNMHALEDIVYSDDDEDVGAEADMNNLNAFMPVSPIPTTRIHKDHPEEPKKVIHALKDPSWIEAMQEELLQFRLQEVWTLMDVSNGKRAIGTKWVFRNKKDERGIMDVKSAFLYGKIEEEVYVCQQPRFEDPDFPDRVYKVEKALYGLHQAPKAWYETLSTYLLDNGFQRGKIDKTLFIRRDKGLQVKQKDDGIFISQDKYVTEILKKFSFTDVKTASTPTEIQKPLLKDEDVCACARYQVNPKVSHLHAVKRIFRYLKGQPKLGLWYLKDSPFDLVTYTDSDYAGASLDMKSTTGGYQFLGSRLISWQCKKQNVVVNSTTEAEYVVVSSCRRQVLWIQNQLLDYGDCNEKKLIQMVKIYTDKNVADLLTKAFDSFV